MRLAWSYIKNYLSRTLSIGLSIILSVTLIIGVGILSDSAKKADIDKLKYDLGNYHVKYKDINSKQLKQINGDGEINKIAVSSYYDSNEFDGKLMMNLIRSDESYLNIFNSGILNGKFPTKENEIALEEWVLLNLGLELNQQIDVKLNKQHKKESYKIVGVLKDRPSYKSKGIVEGILPLNRISDKNLDVYVQFKEDKNIRGNINKIAKEIKIQDKNISINNMLLESIEETEDTNHIFIITCIVSAIVSGIVIYSIFSISIIQRMSDYGTLRAIGGNIYSIFKVIFSELLIISIVSVPIGVILGVFGAKELSYTVGNLFTEGIVTIEKLEISQNLIIWSIIIILLNIFIISFKMCIKINKISPIDCMKRNIDKNKVTKSRFLRTKWLIKVISIEYIISLKNMLRNKKSFILIIISMSMGCIIFILMSFVHKLDEKQLENISKVSTESSSYNVSFAPVTPLKNGLSDKDIEDISELKGVKELRTTQVMYSRMFLDSKEIKNFKYFDEVNEQGYNKKVLNGVLVKSNNEYILKNCIYGYDKSMLNKEKSFIRSGNIDIEKMDNENIALIYIPKANFFTNSENSDVVLNLKVGDTVKVKFRKDTVADEKFARMEDSGEYIEKNFIIGGVVDNLVSVDGHYAGMDSAALVISQEQFKKSTGITNYRMVEIDKFNNADNIKLGKEIIRVSGRNQGAMVRDFTQEMKQIKILEENKMIFIYSIIIVLFVISLFNIINNVSYSLISRINEFGVIRSIGLCNKRFRQMIIFEGLVYGIVSSIVTIIGGIIGQIIIFKIISPNLMNPKFIFNFESYLIVVLVNIFIGIVATYLPSIRIKKLSIIESINSLE
ncbi:FtsX-like permease family protein [Paraclostridium bifermentans]|uniref:FtsX-like permease family protein n=1 Tax=Paraclostridium bifermentans TaxID=1490 RepID=UPI0018A89293|nr:FtsX-like permease family protein [Paraclostridium bifermentans]